MVANKVKIKSLKDCTGFPPWCVSNVFIATGLAKQGEKFMANPDLLIGKTGQFELAHRLYDKNDGTQGTVNEIKKFIQPKDDSFGGF